MKNLTLFALITCLFAMVEMSPSPVFTVRNMFRVPDPMTRKLTRKEIAKLQPRIDGIPRGRVKPHPLTGQIINKKPAIIGGKPALANQFPWMVAMQFRGPTFSWFCGGSVISPSWVLTAGHCVDGGVSVAMFMGTTNWQNTATRITFTSNVMILHPNYNGTLITNDIGLVKVLNPISNAIIQSGRIVPIGLPKISQSEVTFDKFPMIASGWGLTRDRGPISSVLNFVSLLVISNAECNAVYGAGSILSSIMCTSTGTVQAPTNICSGDSGSSLQMKDNGNRSTIYGVVSFGALGSCTQFPSGYTRVASFLQWISFHTGLAIAP